MAPLPPAFLKQVKLAPAHSLSLQSSSLRNQSTGSFPRCLQASAQTSSGAQIHSGLPITNNSSHLDITYNLPPAWLNFSKSHTSLHKHILLSSLSILISSDKNVKYMGGGVDFVLLTAFFLESRNCLSYRGVPSNICWIKRIHLNVCLSLSA